MPGSQRRAGAAAGGLAGLAVIAWAGLRATPRPARGPRPAGHRLGAAELPADLPDPVRRWLVRAAGQAPPRVESAACWGRGWLAEPLGPLRLRLPLRWSACLRPGEALVWRAELTWFGRGVIRAGAEYRDGEGRLVVAGRPRAGPWADWAEALALWVDAVFAAPTALLRPGLVAWEPVSDTAARMRVPGRPPVRLEFDDATGLLGALRTEPDGAAPCRVAFSDYRRFGAVRQAARMVAARRDGPPAVELRLDGVALNADVAAALEAGLAARGPG